MKRVKKMTQNKEAVEKRRKELAQEKLDEQVKYIYFQKGAGQHYKETAYMSGRIVRIEYGEL
jgi:hypothetical protein